MIWLKPSAGEAPSQKDDKTSLDRMKKRISHGPAKSLAEKAEIALRQAVAGVIREHRRLGEPLAVSRDGRVVMVSADELALPEEPLEYRMKRRQVKGHPNLQ